VVLAAALGYVACSTQICSGEVSNSLIPKKGALRDGVARPSPTNALPEIPNVEQVAETIMVDARKLMDG
jgi:hypothetical protein